MNLATSPQRPEIFPQCLQDLPQQPFVLRQTRQIALASPDNAAESPHVAVNVSNLPQPPEILPQHGEIHRKFCLGCREWTEAAAKLLHVAAFLAEISASRGESSHSSGSKLERNFIHRNVSLFWLDSAGLRQRARVDHGVRRICRNLTGGCGKSGATIRERPSCTLPACDRRDRSRGGLRTEGGGGRSGSPGRSGWRGSGGAAVPCSSSQGHGRSGR